MDLWPLLDCTGKLLRKGRSVRLLLGVDYRLGEKPKLHFGRPRFTHDVKDRPVYENLTFAQLRSALRAAG